MGLLLYYMYHTIINGIKKLFKSWVAVVIVISIAFGAVGGFTAVLIGSFVEQSQEQLSDNETEDVTVEEADEDEVEKTAEEWAVIYQNVVLVVLALTVVIFIFNIYPGKRSGEDLFSMADVNLLLTAPIKPQTILLYKTILKMGLMLFSTIYVMAQIPNLVLNLNIPISYAFYLLGIWFLLSIFCKLSSILVYTLTAGKEWAKNIVRRGLWVVLLILGALVFIVMQQQQTDALTAARTIFLSQPAMCVPMFGWITGLTNSILTGKLVGACIYLALILLGLVAIVLIIWNIQVDFYEDCITKATNFYERMEAAKSGMKNNNKHKKETKTNEIGRGQGASCFLVNQFYNRKRFAKLGIITNTGITYIAVAVLVALFLLKIAELPSFAAFGALMLVVCYVRNYGNPIAKETQMTFMYMIPERSFAKLGYSILGSTLIAAIDMIPAFVIGGIMLRADVPSCIVWLLLAVAFEFMLSNTGLLVDLLLPTYIPEVVKSMFAMFFKMFGIFPMAITLALSFFFPLANIFGVLVNVCLGVVFLWISSKLLVIGKA